MKTQWMIGLSSFVLAGLLLVSNAAAQAIGDGGMTPAQLQQMRNTLGRTLNLPKSCFSLGIGSESARRALIKNLGAAQVGLSEGRKTALGPKLDVLMLNVKAGANADTAEREVRRNLPNIRSELCQAGFSSVVFVATDAKDFLEPFHGQLTNPRVYWVERITPQGLMLQDKDWLHQNAPLKSEASDVAMGFVNVFSMVP
jgi:hypothetical protein